MSWDDHEVDNDYAGISDEDDTPAEVFLLRRAAAYQAYFEHMPLRAASLPDGPRLQLYRNMKFGSLIDFSVLDTRQYRSDQACGHGKAADCAAAGDPARSILGRDQERWLFEQLAGGARALDRARAAGADVRSRQRSGGRSERAVLDGQVGWLRCFAATRLRAAQVEPAPPTRSCCPETCTCITAPI